MMKTKFFLVAVVVTAFISGVQPAIAQTDVPSCPVPNFPCVYVDLTKTTGNEDGTPTYPYNTENEGKALAQSYSKGAILLIKNPDSSWTQKEIKRTNAGTPGIPLPRETLYVLLAVLALVLVLVGAQLMRRSRQIQG